MTFKELNTWHQATLQALMNFLPPFQKELNFQINEANFSILADSISLEISTRKNSSILNKISIPVELETIDADGVRVQGLLQCNNGAIGFLEFYRDDGSKIIKLPSPNTFKLNSYGI